MANNELKECIESYEKIAKDMAELAVKHERCRRNALYRSDAALKQAFKLKQQLKDQS